jgi:hypothetical protein
VVTYAWRGEFANAEMNELHAEAFDTRVVDSSEWDWVGLAHAHSLGWVVASDGSDLAGSVNDLGPFYFDTCGFAPTNAGLIALR